MVPSTRVVAMKGGKLQHGMQLFVASSASVIGDVTIGELSAVFYGALVRGELECGIEFMTKLALCLAAVCR